MAFNARGHVDFAQEGFIAQFDYDHAIVSRIKAIQRRRWVQDKGAWIVEPHWPSVRRLLHIASELGWEITAKAREAEQRVRTDSEESQEYSVDIVHDSLGAAWFQCKIGDDDLLLAQVKALPGAEWDDAWWVPTDWEQCCGPLLEIVQSDQRLEVSNAAWHLLQEPDVSDLYIRSSAPPPAAVAPTLGTQAEEAGPSEVQTPTAQDRAAHALHGATHGER